MSRILLLDDDASIRTVVAQALRRAGHEVVSADRIAQLDHLLRDAAVDLLVTDVVLPDGDGIDHMRVVAARHPSLPIVVMSARNTLTTAVRATEAGAYDYLPKPFDLDVLIGTVKRALTTGGQAAGATDLDDAALPLIGRSPAMQEVYRVIARVVGTDLSVLVSGEAYT